MRDIAHKLERTPTYVFSLSTEWDSLSQWRAYGGAGTGYAIGLRRETLQLRGAPSGWLTPCVYEDTLQRELLEAYARIGLERYTHNLEHQKDVAAAELLLKG